MWGRRGGGGSDGAGPRFAGGRVGDNTRGGWGGGGGEGGPAIDRPCPPPYVPRLARRAGQDNAMKIANSLKSLKKRDKNCRVVRRKGRVYVINKVNPRYKARQG